MLRILLLLPALAATARAADPVPLVDFEKTEPADGWHLSRLGLVEVRVEAGTPGAGRRALTLRARPNPDGPLGSIRRAPPVTDWRRFDALRFRARVEARAPAGMRILVFRGRGPAGLVHRFTLESGGWRDVVLPLRDWRDNLQDQVCGFGQVDQWMLRWDSGPGDVTVTGFELVPGERGVASCLPTVEQRLALAFPGGKGRSFTSEHFLLLTDDGSIDAERARLLLAAFEAGLRHLRDDFRIDGALDYPAPFLLFAKRADLHAYVKRLGGKYGVGIELPPSARTGAMLGRVLFAERAADAAMAAEAIKGATYQLLGLTNQPNWIQAGLAHAVETALGDAGDTGATTEAGLGFLAGDAGRMPPWSTFFADRGDRGAAQACSILTFLRARHADRLPAVWEAVRRLRDPVHEAAPAAIARALGMDRDALEAAWRDWAEHAK